MVKQVYCSRYQKDMEALAAPPMPGAMGKKIYSTVSKKAWEEWQQLQTMLINEKSLSLIEPTARAYLSEQMWRYFSNEPTDQIDGYEPQEE